MPDFENAADDPQFAQTVQNRLNAIARMGGSSPRGADSPLVDAESDSERVSVLDELTRRRPPAHD